MSGTQTFNVTHAASLARLELSEEECTHFQEQLGGIIQYIEILSKVEVDGIEPTAHPAPLLDCLREDVAGESLPQELVLGNAPDQALSQIRVPKVVDA